MNYKNALDKLFSMHQFSIKLGLENITRLLKSLGDPQNKYQSIHIAGSNGKGSTASFIASILKEMGYKVGLYTSPHFIKFNERIRINGKQIEDEYIAEFISNLDDYIDNYKPTFFEITTAMAFNYFNDNKVDYAIIETGLGGKLDATNVLVPEASVITSISFEHTNILGENLKDIAREKAGILKKNGNVFLGKIGKTAIMEIARRAKDLECNLFLMEDFIEDYGDHLKLNLDNFCYNIYDAELKGRYQQYNLALSILTLQKSIIINEPSVIDRALKNIVKNTGIQGRFEIYSDNPKVIFDSAHNIESLGSFLEEFNKNFRSKNNIVIFGMMKDKNVTEMTKMIADNFDNLYVSSINYERAMAQKELVDIAIKIGKFASPLEKPGEFIKQFISKKNSESCLVVLGSIYLLGEIKSKLHGNLS